MWPEIEQNINPVNLAAVEISPFDEVLQEDLEMLDDLEFVYWMSEENSEGFNEKDSETAIL